MAMRCYALCCVALCCSGVACCVVVRHRGSRRFVWRRVVLLGCVVACVVWQRGASRSVALSSVVMCCTTMTARALLRRDATRIMARRVVCLRRGLS